MRWPALVISLSLSLSIPMSAQQVPQGASDSVATRFLDLLVQKKFADAEAMMTETMVSALPLAKLDEMWATLQTQAGAYVSRGAVRSHRSGQYDVVVIAATFAEAPLDVKVSVDAGGKVAGLFFAPPAAAPASSPATPADVLEKEIVVGAQGWPLPGTLTLPPGTDRVPLVILVAGSGPQDRNETIGPNAPLRDLAVGLARHGIGVLRYDKRTMVFAQRMVTESGKSLTVEQEVVADVLAAIDSARHMARIDPARIYLAGHSLGGYLVPRILTRDRQLAGAVVLAGSTRHLEDLVLEQLDYLAAQQAGGDKGDAAQREMLRGQAVKIKALTDKDRDTGGYLIGAPPAYWLDLRVYDPVNVAASLNTPMLILQGNRDYQVTAADFARWQTLSGKANVTLKQYPSLNHLFMTGTGPSTPAEYAKAGQVAPEVIDDIAGWINRRGSPRP